MSTRLDPDPAPGTAPLPAPLPFPPAGIVNPLDPDDRSGGHALPGDHPAWMRDALSISQRARALLAKVRPVAIKVIVAWEHRLRSIVIGGHVLSVDASGSYRLN